MAGILTSFAHLHNRKHEKQHIRPHKCRFEGCRYAEGGDPGGFGQPRELENHEKTHLPGSEPSFRCYVVGCNRGATRIDNMVRHLRSQHGIQNLSQPEVERMCRPR
ncbi:hypothetical protein B0T16DRAFT_489175 [Cercophora newfieldiana]|uniref:C2H2-type domain-containing protein n=1 Tax=Cercophora newfieldiana TaxID=92897 RepID=A0AA39YEL0_9PEZI|nr:hypothetical protein B0T16DRAFT_489175 [Cercophora newfieldiana]